MINKISKKKSEFIDIPVAILQDRNVAILESLAEYLHAEKNMKYSEIAILLNRDQRTIWTVCNRAKKKRIVSNKNIASYKTPLNEKDKVIGLKKVCKKNTKNKKTNKQ